MINVMQERKNMMQMAVRMAILFASTAAFIAWVVPSHGEYFHYLFAGTFASAVTLVAAFGLFVTGRL
jgi:hypothetical protein